MLFHRVVGRKRRAPFLPLETEPSQKSGQASSSIRPAVGGRRTSGRNLVTVADDHRKIKIQSSAFPIFSVEKSATRRRQQIGRKDNRGASRVSMSKIFVDDGICSALSPTSLKRVAFKAALISLSRKKCLPPTLHIFHLKIHTLLAVILFNVPYFNALTLWVRMVEPFALDSISLCSSTLDIQHVITLQKCDRIDRNSFLLISGSRLVAK